jgi:hypothetical protein
MNYLAHLKRATHCPSCRWIVKYNTEGFVREVKLVYNPLEYSRENAKRYGRKARKLYDRSELIEVLEMNKKKNG